MEGEFQDQGQLDQDLEEWLFPRGSQYVHGFFSEEEKQESIQMEDLAPEGAIISKQATEGETSTMVVVKWSDELEESGDNIDSPLCGGLYKEEEDYLVPWSGIYPPHRGESILSPYPSTLSDHLTTNIVDVSPSGAWLLIIAPYGAGYSIHIDSFFSSSEKKP